MAGSTTPHPPGRVLRRGHAGRGTDHLASSPVLEFHAVAEPRPGPRFQERFEATWPAYQHWYLRDGDAARPSYLACRHALELHMPELVPTWERLVDLAGGGDMAARMLSLWDPPPLVTGCSQAVRARAAAPPGGHYGLRPQPLGGGIAPARLAGR